MHDPYPTDAIMLGLAAEREGKAKGDRSYGPTRTAVSATNAGAAAPRALGVYLEEACIALNIAIGDVSAATGIPLDELLRYRRGVTDAKVLDGPGGVGGKRAKQSKAKEAAAAMLAHLKEQEAHRQATIKHAQEEKEAAEQQAQLQAAAEGTYTPLPDAILECVLCPHQPASGGRSGLAAVAGEGGMSLTEANIALGRDMDYGRKFECVSCNFEDTFMPENDTQSRDLEYAHPCSRCGMLHPMDGFQFLPEQNADNRALHGAPASPPTRSPLGPGGGGALSPALQQVEAAMGRLFGVPGSIGRRRVEAAMEQCGGDPERAIAMLLEGGGDPKPDSSADLSNSDDDDDDDDDDESSKDEEDEDEEDEDEEEEIVDSGVVAIRCPRKRLSDEDDSSDDDSSDGDDESSRSSRSDSDVASGSTTPDSNNSDSDRYDTDHTLCSDDSDSSGSLDRRDRQEAFAAAQLLANGSMADGTPTDVHTRWMRAIGRVFGIAIVNELPLGVPLVPVLFELMLDPRDPNAMGVGRPPAWPQTMVLTPGGGAGSTGNGDLAVGCEGWLERCAQVDPLYVRSLRQVWDHDFTTRDSQGIGGDNKDNDDDDDDDDDDEEDSPWNLDFTYTSMDAATGNATTCDLMKGGETVRVTNRNKTKWVALQARRVILGDDGAFAARIRALRAGLFDVIPREMLMLLSGEELRLLVCGNDASKVDVDDWKSSCGYEGGMSSSDKVVCWFWHMVESMDNGEHRALLSFWSGSGQPPLFGFDPGASVFADEWTISREISQSGGEESVCFIPMCVYSSTSPPPLPPPPHLSRSLFFLPFSLFASILLTRLLCVRLSASFRFLSYRLVVPPGAPRGPHV